MYRGNDWKVAIVPGDVSSSNVNRDYNDSGAKLVSMFARVLEIKYSECMSLPIFSVQSQEVQSLRDGKSQRSNLSKLSMLNRDANQD